MTERQTAVNPAALAALAGGNLENFIVASTPGGIEAQERRGQADLVASTTMPLELRPSREAFESLGFTFGGAIDEVFQQATLPAGWTRTATSHPMHSNILDDQGRQRVSVFYKAAFYDRRAHARLTPRYIVEHSYPDGEDGDIIIAAIDTKTGERLKVFGRSGSRDYKLRDKHFDQADKWMIAQFPNWTDPTAYWRDGEGDPQ